MGDNDVTVTDCEFLWQMGNDYLPKLADIYDGIRSQMGARLTDETGVFSRKVPGDQLSQPDVHNITTNTDGSGPVFPKYVQLRDEVERILASTATNLRDTAVAVNQAAWAYAETDGLNAGDLKSRLDLTHPGGVEYNIPQ